MADELETLRDLDAKYRKALSRRQVTENFGQKEARDLDDRAFRVSVGDFSSQDREEAFAIANGFREWAETYGG